MITQIPMPSPLNSSVTSLPYNGHTRSSFSPPTSSSPFRVPSRRRCFKVQASSLVLPLLPFPIDQVFVPSESKTLHLYEARYIALLEELLLKKDKLLVHFVLDQIGFGRTSVEASFVAKYGCLAILERVQQLEIGALVSIRGVGRVKLLHIEQGLPYLTGEVIPLKDNCFPKITEINSKVLELKESLRSLNSLEIKLKAPRDALLQTQTINSLVWAENQLSLDGNTHFIPPLAERISFAALQPVSGATRTELVQLHREKLTAMDMTDTLERLKKSIKIARNNIAVVAAKLAIQSLEMP